MTFEEIEQKLPNGFHDVKILSVAMDSLKSQVTMCLSLDVNEGEVWKLENHRPGTLVVHSVALFFLEPPGYPFESGGKGISASGDSWSQEQVPASMDALIQTLPLELLRYRFILYDWNSFMYLAAKDATFSWD